MRKILVVSLLCLTLLTRAYAEPDGVDSVGGEETSIVEVSGLDSDNYSGSSSGNYTGNTSRGSRIGVSSILRSLFYIGASYIALQRIQGVDAGNPAIHIPLPFPGRCVTQTGVATIESTCDRVNQDFTISGHCCLAGSGTSLVIDASNVTAPAGDCCSRCIGRGQHLEDSQDQKVNIGPCAARTGKHCESSQALCTSNMCSWGNGDQQSGCFYTGISPQIELFTIVQGDYGVNITIGTDGKVATITPFTIKDNLPLGTLSTKDCQNFAQVNSRHGFMIEKKPGNDPKIVDWSIKDTDTYSHVDVECKDCGGLDYTVWINKAVKFRGLCKDSVTKDKQVNSWIIPDETCGGDAPLPLTLFNPTSYKYSVVTTPWAKLGKEIPCCMGGFIITWQSGSTTKVVAIPLGTIVPDVPDDTVEPGLYDGKQKVTYIAPAGCCGCSVNPGSQIKFKYKAAKGCGVPKLLE